MFFSKLKSVLRSSESNGTEAKYSDSFADTLALDLKRCSIEAILGALSKTEGKYLSTILQNSFFPVESIVFTPLDNDTAVETENFFKIHSAIDPLFEQNFYRTILLKEYRTEHGGIAIPSEQIIVTVQPSEGSTDNLTQEESYQITLRGSKKRFSAQIVLGSPKSIREGASLQQLSGMAKDREEPAFEKAIGQSLGSSSENKSVEVTVKDGNGFSKKAISLPAIVGREGDSQYLGIDNKLLVNARFVSRNQIVLFSVGDKVYFFVPESSKLLVVVNESRILSKMTLFEVTATTATITFGQPEDVMDIVALPNETALYPTITLRTMSSQKTTNATPIPHVS